MAREWNPDLLEEIDIDTEALLAACSERAEKPIFQDSYDGGELSYSQSVAKYDGQSFATYHDLAAHFGLDAARFQRSCDAPT